MSEQKPTKKKRFWQGCLLTMLIPFMLCGLCYGGVAIYVALTETPFDDEVADAYALLPEKTTGAALLTDFELRTDPRLDTIFPSHFTHTMIDPIFVMANLSFEDVSQVALINVDYNSAAILIYTPQAKTSFDYAQSQTDMQAEEYEGSTLYRFTSPYAEGYGEEAVNKNLETWAWVLLNDNLLVAGGESTVKNILDIYDGRQPNLFESRPVMRNLITLLRDYPNAYYQFRREEDILAGKAFSRIIQIILIPVAGLGNLAQMQAGGYAAANIEDGCTSIQAIQMPSRSSAAIIYSLMGGLGAFENFSRPNNLSWDADSIENIRINDVYYTQIFWNEEKCAKMRSENPPFVFPP